MSTMRNVHARHAPHAPLALAVSALLAIAGTAPASAQQGVGGQAFRTTLGATLLMPQAPGLAMDSVRLPSGRAVLEIQSNPVFGLHFGGLRLAPNVLWADSSEFGGLDAARYQIGLMAGIAGFRLNFTTGRFRIAPFVDGGLGLAQARIDQGGYMADDGSSVVYQPVLVDTTTLMAGGGGGVAVDAILGPGLTLALVGGYWHFQSMDMSEAGEPLVDPLTGMWVGAGVKLAFQDVAYYWRHSGEDGDPPVLVMMNHEPDENGVVDVGEARTTLSLRASDAATVDSIFVNGRKLPLVPIRGGDVPSVNTSVDLMLNPGPNQIQYVAFDGAGNRLQGEWEIHGIPLDQDGPRIAVVQPQNDLSISSERVMVEAVIRDRSPIEQVLVNGIAVRTTQGTREDRTTVEAGPEDFVVRFSSTTNVPSARFEIAIAAVDTAGNTQIETVTIRRADLAVAAEPTQPEQRPAQQVASGPQIEIHTPAEWAGGGTRGFAAEPKRSIRVTGLARYAEGIQEVLANNKRMSLQRQTNNPGIVQFSGFVEPPSAGSQGEVEILVRGMDGEQSVRTYTTRTAAAVAPTGPAQFENVAGAANRQRWAVIIGVSDYIDESIGDLQYADEDARAVYDFFRSPAAGMGGIPESNMQLLVDEDATARNIRSAMTTFLRQSTPDDVIFIYMAAHGAPDPYRPDDLYILAHDTEIDDIAASAVSMGDVNRAIQDAYAYNKVLITDACHSAGVGSGTRAGLSNNQINRAFLDYMNNSAGGFVAFTASEANQLSQEGDQYGGGHGVFTHFFLEGLRGAADDASAGGDGDRIVTLGEVMEYTRDRVRRATRNAQVPTISSTSYDRFWPMSALLDGTGQGETQQ